MRGRFSTVEDADMSRTEATVPNAAADAHDAMARIELDLPDALWQRMQSAHGVDWSAVAAKAIESHLASRNDESYASGYSWARDRAEPHDLEAMVHASSYASAANVVRASRGFSQRDEFGDQFAPSDEMWEAFVDGATQRYRDMSHG
jgi:hypothetical protein